MTNPVAACRRLDLARAGLDVDDEDAVRPDDDGIEVRAHADAHVREDLEGFGQTLEKFDFFRTFHRGRLRSACTASGGQRDDGENDSCEDVERVGIGLKEDESCEPEQEDDEADCREETVGQLRRIGRKCVLWLNCGHE